jgi:hypothetical protein
MAISRRSRLFLNTSLLGAGGRSSIAAGLEAQGLALPTPNVSPHSMHVRCNLLSRFPALI